MNNYMPYNQNQPFQPYQVTQYFPQPQGSIYMIGSSNDVANVPVGTGLSAAICLREGIIYLKTIQNGSPMLLGYRLNPLENSTSQESIQKQTTQFQSQQNLNNQPTIQTQNQEQTIEQRILAVLEDFDNRLKKIENIQDKPKGGASEWPL